MMKQRTTPLRWIGLRSGMGRAVSLCFAFGVALSLAACGTESSSSSSSVEAARSGAVPATVTVQRGDTIYAVSRRYGVPVKSIIELNGLQPPYALQIGQVLSMPRGVYVVQRGDTLYAVARATGTEVRDLVAWNGLQPPYSLQVGQTLTLSPAGDQGRGAAVAASRNQPPPPVAAPARGVDRSDLPPPVAPTAPVAPPPVVVTPPPAEPSPPVEARAEKPPAPPARSGKTFAWPLQGELLTGFGPAPNGTRNDGINIVAAKGDSVRAAENGVVVYADSQLKGFGNLLLIKHDGGWMTAYAHNDKLLVKKGQTVKRGQVIARAGQTGNVESPQVHFELRKGGQAVDPQEYLEPRG